MSVSHDCAIAKTNAPTRSSTAKNAVWTSQTNMSRWMRLVIRNICQCPTHDKMNETCHLEHLPMHNTCQDEWDLSSGTFVNAQNMSRWMRLVIWDICQCPTHVKMNETCHLEHLSMPNTCQDEWDLSSGTFVNAKNTCEQFCRLQSFLPSKTERPVNPEVFSANTAQLAWSHCARRGFVDGKLLNQHIKFALKTLDNICNHTRCPYIPSHGNDLHCLTSQQCCWQLWNQKSAMTTLKSIVPAMHSTFTSITSTRLIV